MGQSGKVAGMVSAAVAAILLSSCQMVHFMPSGPAPGTTGFYDFEAIPSKVATEDMVVRRMSIPGDRVFVYRVNDDMVVIGEGNPDANAKIKPLDEVASGVTISPDAAKKLAAFLDKVTAQYNTKDKKASVYYDFRILTNGVVTDKTDKVPDDYIVARFQYVYNLVNLEHTELTLVYLGGTDPKELKISEITALIANLKK